MRRTGSVDGMGKMVDEKHIQKLPEGKRVLTQLRCGWKDSVSYIVRKQGLRICTGLNKPILSTYNPGKRLTTDFSESLPRSLISWALRVSPHVRILHIKLLSYLSVGRAYESTDFTQTYLSVIIQNHD
jgi:hypothetical protein